MGYLVMSYYEILTVNASCTFTELFAAYEKKLRSTREDVQRRQEVDDAFSVLANSESKAIYDQFLPDGHIEAAAEALVPIRELQAKLKQEPKISDKEAAKQREVEYSKKVAAAAKTISENIKIAGSWGALIGTDGIDTSARGTNKGLILAVYREVEFKKFKHSLDDNSPFVSAREIRSELNKLLCKQLHHAPRLVAKLYTSEQAQAIFMDMLKNSKSRNADLIIHQAIHTTLMTIRSPKEDATPPAQGTWVSGLNLAAKSDRGCIR